MRMKHSIRLVMLGLPMWALAAGSAHAALHDYIVAPQGGDITGAQLSAMLQKGNVTLDSSGGKHHGSGNVFIEDTVTWTSNSTLTLVGSNNVSFRSAVTAQGNTAGVVVNANTANGQEPATGSGKYDIGKNGVVSLTGTTPVLTINGTSYIVINSLGSASDAGTPPPTPTLQGMAAPANLGGNYALGSNINASSTSSWRKGHGFTPIGTSSVPFTGKFDGLGHTVTQLTINTSPNYPIKDNSNVGLFGQIGGMTQSGTVRNIGLVNESVTANTYVGGIAGQNYGVIDNVYVTGSVNGGQYDIGGLVGQNLGAIKNSYATANVATIASTKGVGFDVAGLIGNNYGTISNSYATGNVSGGNNEGGLVGHCHSYCTITNSYATGTVNGYNLVGGLVGYMDSATNSGASSIANSYAQGAVSGTGNVGGLVGQLSAANQSGGVIVTTSYASGAVTMGGGGAGGVGGLIGSNFGGNVSSSYWDATASGQAASAGGTPLSTDDMKTCSELQGFNFVSVYATGNNWVIVDTDGTYNNDNGVAGATYPKLAADYFKKKWNQSMASDVNEADSIADRKGLQKLLAQENKKP